MSTAMAVVVVVGDHFGGCWWWVAVVGDCGGGGGSSCDDTALNCTQHQTGTQVYHVRQRDEVQVRVVARARAPRRASTPPFEYA